MRRNSGSYTNSGAYTSPGTPEHSVDVAGEVPKTWSSERVPLPSSSSSRRHISAAALMPFNSGRTLPSKWDDAERWITSPSSGSAAFKTSTAQLHRRPKSKSGPLGSSGVVYLSNYSPIEGGSVRNFIANSPLTAGVFVPDGVSVHYDAGIAAKPNSLHAENNMRVNDNVLGLSDLQSGTLVKSQGDKLEGTKDEGALVTRVVSRRDMATQMSPEGSTHSSSKARLSFSTLLSPKIPSTSQHPAVRDEVRDVEVDKGTPPARQSRKLGLRKMKDSANMNDLPSSTWSVAEAPRNILKLQREEAKITAWENLQKAKAEAAIQKLEMKLEKKRSASVDKIMNKLRAAQMKAQAMRNSLPDRTSSTSRRRIFCCI